MTSVYLPVEVSKRELVARAFLATRLARAGHDAIIFRADLFHRVGWPGGGVYIGKNFLQPPPPHEPDKYQEMKDAGMQVYLLDEEGGIYAGDAEDAWEEQLRNRYDPSLLQEGDRYLVWGEWQSEVGRSQAPELDIEIVGSPNFDVFQPKYSNSLSAFDTRETGGASDFILVNTRFVFANALNNADSHFMHHGFAQKELSLDFRFGRLRMDGIRFYQFISLVHAISSRLPGEQIIVRPHPNERHETYQEIFGPLPNVKVTGTGDVGPWIRRCKALIHNGCTTAIQADVAGKQVISYVPEPQDDLAVPGLPNRVGVQAKSEEEVIRILGSEPRRSTGRPWGRTVSHLDSIEKIAGLVEREAAPSSSLARLQRKVRRYALSDGSRRAAALASKSRREYRRKVDAHFDSHFFGRIPELVACAADFYGIEPRVERPSRFCYIITSGT